MADRRKRSSNVAEKRMERTLDHLSEFDDFRAKLLPALRKDIESGMTAKEIREKYQATAQARLIMALLADDDSKAIRAAQDILDRTEGKAVERKAHVHKFQDLPEEQLDALLATELSKITGEND